MRRRSCGLPLVLLLAACSESPFAPTPEAVTCGSDEVPCTFRCTLDCASTTVEMAAACMQSLQGTLDATRTRCDFPDGGRVEFAWPIPPQGSELTARRWSLKIQRDQSTCLAITAQPLPWVAGGLDAVTEVRSAGETYRHELKMASASDGGLTPVPTRVVVDCPDGRRFAGAGAAICADCPGGDCLNLPLVQLDTTWSGSTLDFQLRAGQGITPLFSCR